MQYKDAIEKMKLWRALCNMDVAEKVENTHLVVRTVDLAAVLDLAIKSVEATMPMEPLPQEGEKELCAREHAPEDMSLLGGLCPSCGYPVLVRKEAKESSYRGEFYCSQCGRPLLWPEHEAVAKRNWMEE